MPNSTYQPFPREIFNLRPSNPSRAEEVRFLIETRLKIKQNYGKSYRAILDALKAVDSDSTPQMAELSQEQKSELKRFLLKARDETARGFSQTILLLETTANELASGTFPVENRPVTSFDFGEWLQKALDWLVDLIHDIADVFGDLGMGPIADGLNWTADQLDNAGKQAKKWMSR